jgi:hypothetical protein
MESGAYRGYPGNGGPMASGWLPVVSETDFQSARADWAKTDSELSAPVDLPNGGRESDVGCVARSRGASHVGP